MIFQDFPWHVLLSMLQAPFSQTNWSSETLSNAYYLGGRITSTGAQNAKRAYKVPLAAGTYTADLWHGTSSNRGIYTLKVDTVAVGTIDGYSAGSVSTVHGTIVGFTVAGNGLHLVELVLATKNASSSSYVGDVQALGLTRTA